MPNPLDLELSLERGDAGTYEVTLRAWPDAENEWEEGPFVVTIDLAALRALVGNPEGYGRALSGSLFTNADLRAAFATARGKAGPNGLRMRIRTARNTPELQRVQWELLTDPEGTGYLSTREDVVLSRYLARGASGGTAGLPGRKAMLRWVIAAANPQDLVEKYSLTAIDVAAEHARFRDLSGVEVAFIPQVTPGGAAERCTLATLIERARDADVLYLACHGRMINDTPWLLLENEDGLAARVSGKKLVEAVQGMTSKPRLIVLASCESGGGTGDAFSAIGPRLVAAGVPAVVAMQGLVTITLVEDFMPVFFRELVRDGRIDRALAFARRAVSEDHPDWWSPVLYMNLRSGQLWQELEISTPGGPGHTVIGSTNVVTGDIIAGGDVIISPGGAVIGTKKTIPHEIEKPENAFFGRVKELTELHKAVCDQKVQTIEIYGVDGTGKTSLAKVLAAGIKEQFLFGFGLDTTSPEKQALARQLVDGVKDNFPDGQVYLNLRGSGGLPDSKEQASLKPIPALRSVLESFGINPGLASDAVGIDEDIERERLEGIYQSELSGKRAILLLDNAANSAQVMPFLSPPGDCLVIITAWQRFTSLPGLYTQPLGKMRIDEAKAMFTSLALNVDRLVDELVIECDLLPSVILLWAGILSSSTSITPELALRKMRDENRRPPQLLALGESALSVSYQMLTEQQKSDWRRLAVLPLEFDEIEAAVVWGLLMPGATQEQKEDAWFEADLRLIELRNYNLVEYNESQRHYSLLNAFRPYARMKMTSQEANDARQALEAYRAV